MSQSGYERVTEVIARLEAGDRSASEELMVLVYDELRMLAQSYMRAQRPSHTLQATALVHEAYVKVFRGQQVAWESRAHFFAVAAKAMRQVLANYARDRKRLKRGGNRRRVTLSAGDSGGEETDADLVDLDEALSKLQALDERQAEIVELRFLSGMTVEEVARVLDISTATVEREWRAARAWLSSELSEA